MPSSSETRPFSRATAVVSSPTAPRPSGNYSQVIRQGNLLHVSGWMGEDPKTGKIVSPSIQSQTNQAIRNIESCLKAAGSSLDKIVQRRIYLIEMKQLRLVDEIWGRWLKEPYPVSTCVAVTGLAKEGAMVEIEVVAEA